MAGITQAKATGRRPAGRAEEGLKITLAKGKREMDAEAAAAAAALEVRAAIDDERVAREQAEAVLAQETAKAEELQDELTLTKQKSNEIRNSPQLRAMAAAGEVPGLALDGA